MKRYIELNVADIKVKHLNKLKSVAENDGFETTMHGWDHLFIYSDSSDDWSYMRLINDLDYTCTSIGVDYFSLLDLD